MSVSISGRRGVEFSMKQHDVMGRVMWWVAAGFAVGLSGCGYYSNDDLVFLAAVPKKSEVAMEVEGSGGPAQALRRADALGETAEFYGHIVATATNVNTGVGAILDMVDSLGKGYAPTTRTETSRIWGPIANVDGKGFGLRLEIQRNEADDGAPHFVFCLHFGRTSEITGDGPSCEDQEKGGFHRVFFGSYDPRAVEAGARSGSGEITIDFEASQKAGTAKPDEHGRLHFTYDFSKGGEAKKVELDWLTPAAVVGKDEIGVYRYERTLDDDIDFFVQYYENWADLPGAAREVHSIDSCWNESGPGRATVLIEEGDIPMGENANATECWNGQKQRTYIEFEYTPDPANQFSAGDVAACPDC